MTGQDKDDQNQQSEVSSGGLHTVTTENLMGQEKVISIIHDNSEYQLRITANNKLILTK